MRLYHFTSRYHAPGILSGGLWQGDVPTGPESGFHAAWFTTDAVPTGHGLSDGSDKPLTPEWAAKLGLPPGTQMIGTVDKRAVRIAVDLPGAEATRWARWAPRNVEPRFLAGLHKVAPRWRTWYFVRGVVTPSQFKEIALRREGGSYTPATPDELADLSREDALK